MNITRFLLAALVAFVFLAIASTVLHPVIFPDEPPVRYLYERTTPKVAFEFVAILITAVLLAYIFPVGYRGGKPWAEGLRFGMLMGVLLSLPASLYVYAKTEVELTAAVTSVLWAVIRTGIAGGLIGAVYGRQTDQ